jgi:hypothetical protein
MDTPRRGRPALPAPVIINSKPSAGVVVAEGAAADTIAAGLAAVSAEQVSFSQRIGARFGRRAVADVAQKLTTVGSLLELREIKESKQYRGMRICVPTATGEEVLTIHTFEDYCTQIEGRSRQQVDEDLLNLNALGADLLESFQTLGLSYRQMRDMRQIPADARMQLLEAAKAGDRETVIEAARDLVEGHAREVTKAEKKIATLQKDIDAKARVLSDKSDKITELETELAKRELTLAEADEQAQLDAIRDAGAHAEIAIRKLVRAAFDILNAPKAECTATAATNAVQYIAVLFGQIINQAGIPVDFEEQVTPHWLRNLNLAARKKGDPLLLSDIPAATPTPPAN